MFCVCNLKLNWFLLTQVNFVTKLGNFGGLEDLWLAPIRRAIYLGNESLFFSTVEQWFESFHNVTGALTTQLEKYLYSNDLFLL